MAILGSPDMDSDAYNCKDSTKISIYNPHPRPRPMPRPIARPVGRPVYGWFGHLGGALDVDAHHGRHPQSSSAMFSFQTIHVVPHPDWIGVQTHRVWRLDSRNHSMPSCQPQGPGLLVSLGMSCRDGRFRFRMAQWSSFEHDSTAEIFNMRRGLSREEFSWCSRESLASGMVSSM